MSTTETLPIYFQLIEIPAKTNKLVEEINSLTERFNLTGIVTLVHYNSALTDNGEDVLIYKIKTKSTPKDENGENIINFLDHIFKKMFDRYPSYVEITEE